VVVPRIYTLFRAPDSDIMKRARYQYRLICRDDKRLGVTRMSRWGTALVHYQSGTQARRGEWKMHQYLLLTGKGFSFRLFSTNPELQVYRLSGHDCQRCRFPTVPRAGHSSSSYPFDQTLQRAATVAAA
jgi:hypothetical protein